MVGVLDLLVTVNGQIVQVPPEMRLTRLGSFVTLACRACTGYVTVSENTLAERHLNVVLRHDNDCPWLKQTEEPSQ